MVRPIASPDGNRLVYSFGKYFHAPVPFALPIRALDLESGELETMEQIAGVDTRTLQWSGKAALSAASRSGHLSSEDRRVGKDCATTCRARWCPYTSNNKQTHIQ